MLISLAVDDHSAHATYTDGGRPLVPPHAFVWRRRGRPLVAEELADLRGPLTRPPLEGAALASQHVLLGRYTHASTGARQAQRVP